ncbi:unnamed protein product [Brassica oleracea]
MAYNLLITVLLVLASLSLASCYSHPTRDVLFKQDDVESFSMTTSRQGSSMLDVEGLVKVRSLQVLFAGSKGAVNKASKSSGSKKRKHKSKVGSLDVSAVVGIIIAAIVVTIIIICVIYFFYVKHKTKKAQSLGQVNGSASSLSDGSGSGRAFASSFSGLSGAASPVFHHSGSVQGLHSIHGSFNVSNSGLNGLASAGVQQQNGRFASSNLPVGLSQISYGSSHGLTNRGGGLGVSPILGNAGSRIQSSMGNMVGGGSMGRTLSSGGGLSIPSLGSRLNNGSGNIGQMMSGVLPQGSPQAFSMLGNSYPAAGGLSQNHVQAMNGLSSMSLLNEMNSSNDISPFDINNDFPQLTSRPTSAQGQLGTRLQQGLGLSPIVQQNQEFSIQNEDFPALPGYKGSSADYPMDLHHKEQLHENSILMMQSQQLSMGRSGGFNLGGAYTSHRTQQQQQQHAQAVSSSGVSLNVSDIFSSSHPSYHSQTGVPPGIGLRPMNSANSVTGMGYDQPLQQYQHHQNTPQYRLHQMSAIGQPFRDVGLKPMQVTQSNPDRFSLLGLLSVIKMSDPDLTSLALGIDLTSLGLNLNSTENLHKTFASPWSNEPSKDDPEFSVPQCYYAKDSPPLHQGLFAKLLLETLFYVFYSMPRDEAQLYATNELYHRGWFYHKEHKLWFIRIGEPLVKTNTYERGSYHCFDPISFEIVQKENSVLYYEMLEKRPSLSQH